MTIVAKQKHSQTLSKKLLGPSQILRMKTMMKFYVINFMTLMKNIVAPLAIPATCVAMNTAIGNSPATSISTPCFGLPTVK